MSDARDGRGRAPTRRGREERPAGNHLRRLLRHAHIFAATVREVLELKLLRESTSLPLTLSQFHVLRIMALNGQSHVGEVADFLGISAPAATRNTDKLERLGLIDRRPSKDDRRATLLTVSARGRALVGGYDQLLDRRLGTALEDFGTAETDRLSDLLERFFTSLLKGEASGTSRRFCLRCAAYLDGACPVGRLSGGCPYQGSSGPGHSPGRKRRKAETRDPGPSRRGRSVLRRAC